MDETQFRRLLTNTLDEEIQNVNLWNQIENKLSAPSTKTVRTGFRLGKAAFIALLLTVTAVAAYAFYQDVVAPGDPGVVSVAQADLLTYFDQTEIIEGEFSDHNLTVILDYAYADANRVTVGYTVRGESPDGQRMMAFSNPALMTADGQPLDRLLLVANQQTQEEGAQDETGRFSSALTTNFITPDFDLADGEMLNLNLAVDVGLSYLDSGEFPAPGMMMAGRVEFNFGVPFINGAVIEIGQTVETAQQTVEMQRAVVTPSMTRLDMCFDLPPVTLVPGWSPFIVLSINDEPVFVGQTETYGLEDRYDLNSRCKGVIIPLTLEAAGEWRVEITEFRELGGEGLAPITGPWVFTFAASESK